MGIMLFKYVLYYHLIWIASSIAMHGDLSSLLLFLDQFVYFFKIYNYIIDMLDWVGLRHQHSGDKYI